MVIKVRQKIKYFLHPFTSLAKGIFSFVLLFLFSQSMLYGQDELQKTFFRLKLHDKTNFYGELLYQTKDSLIIKHSKGVIYSLHRSEIKRSVKGNQGYIRKGKFYPAIINYDEGYVVPNGIGLRKGEVYYENTMAGWNEINAGITDYISLKIGFDNFAFMTTTVNDFDFSNQQNPVLFLSAKLAIPIIKDKWSIGITPAVIHFTNEEKYFDYGYLFLSNTFGSKNNNFTIGTGTDLFRRYNNSKSSFITLSGSLRVGRRISLISEHWILINHKDDYLYRERIEYNSFGIKIIGNHITTSITFVRYYDPGDSYSKVFNVPLISIAIPIAKTWGS